MANRKTELAKATEQGKQITQQTAKQSKSTTKPATQTLQSVIQSWLDNGLKTVSPAEKRKLFDAAWPEIEAMGLSAETVLSNKQVIDLQKLLGKYGANYLLKKPVQPATQPAATQPAATQPAATQSAATQPAATQPAGRQNLMFNDMLKDLGLTGKESANSAALKKVQDWLKARPGYKAGAKTDAYIKQLSEQPTAPVTPAPVKSAAQQPRTQAIKNGRKYKFENKQKYVDAYRAYKAGSATFVGNDGNTKFFNDYVGFVPPKGVDVSNIAKIVSSGR